MKHIVEVGLKNYQGHKDTVVNFEPGFNVIIGESDMGKSALKRGIEAVLFNKYVSEEDIRIGEDSFENYVLFSDGSKITREKGKKVNKYVIEYPNGETFELNKFGVNVPKEVMDLHGMYPVQIGKTQQSLNVADQLDGPFFLKNTPGERAKMISSISKTQVIDEAAYNTMSDCREKKATLKRMVSENKSLEKDAAELEFVEEAKIALKALENDYDLLADSVSRYMDSKSKLRSIEDGGIQAANQRAIIELYKDCEIQQAQVDLLISDFNKYTGLRNKFNIFESEKSRQEQLSRNITQLNGIDDIVPLVDKLSEDMSRYQRLQRMVSDYISLKNNQAVIKERVDRMDDINELPDQIDNLVQDIRRYNALDVRQKEVETLLSRQAKGKEVIKEIDSALNKSVEAYQTELAKHGKCPTCFSEITEVQFNQIKDNLI